jgi:nicotinamide riboside kinase
VRIYFIGAHSTGKTTMARYVAENYGIPLLTEVARSLLAERELTMETLRSDLPVVDSFQKGIFFRQMEVEKGRDSFVSDRSFDNLAYAAQHSRVLREVLETPAARAYVERLRSEDVLIFFVRPVRSTMRNDGVREQVEWEGLQQIDGMVKFMLEMWGLRHFQISTGSMQERARFVDAIITGHAASGRPGKKGKRVRRV